MFGNAVSNQLHGHIDIGGGRLGAEMIGFKPNGVPIQDVKIVGASQTSLRDTFVLGVASSFAAGLLMWYLFGTSRS